MQFGSTVTGVTHARNDVDLAVLLTRLPESYDRESDLQAALQSCVQDRDVDLVILNRADPLLLRQVTEKGSLLYGDPGRWQEFRACSFKRYDAIFREHASELDDQPTPAIIARHRARR